VKVALSGLFGRFVARAYLERYFGLSVFAHLGRRTFRLDGRRRITIKRKKSRRGDLPDWLATDASLSKLFIAEAKGCHDKSGADQALGRAWAQADRIDVISGGRKARVKRIAIATRWGVASGGPNVPIMAVRDPDETGDMTRDEMDAALIGIARLRTADLLKGVGYKGLAHTFRELSLSQAGSSFHDAQQQALASLWCANRGTGGWSHRPPCRGLGYLRQHHPEVLRDEKLRKHFHSSMFHGFDFDNTMLRIGSMNMLLHGIENPAIVYRDSLAQDHADENERYTLVLANPPFAGSLDYESTAKDLLEVVKTKKTELLFLALFLRLLKPGGRAAVIVPDGVLFGSSNAHKELRRMLVESQKLEAVIKLPSGVFRPYAGVSTAILIFTKTNSGGTDFVWFYDVKADGWSLDDKRDPLLPDAKLGPTPTETLSEEEHAKSNLPDVLTRWKDRSEGERKRQRTAQSFSVPQKNIVAQDFDLSLSRYKEVVHDEVAHVSPRQIIAELKTLETEIQQGLAELERMVG
jgi:N-6 DNA Methylase